MATAEMAAIRKRPRLHLRPIPFILVHLLCLSAFFVEFDLAAILWCAALYYSRMFFVTAGYHRYFSHRSFKTSRIVQFVLAFLCMTSAQKGVLWWASHHRDHHRYSDTEDDPHSPLRRGFWWSHVGWILNPQNDATHYSRIGDLKRYPELRWLNRCHWVPPTSLGITIFLLGGWKALIWGFFISTVLLWHGSFTVNSLGHIIGRQRYSTADGSKNSLVLALLTLGEGWHNNHHRYQASVRQGFFWWEIDITYYILVFFSWLGLVWDLRQPPLKTLEVS